MLIDKLSTIVDVQYTENEVGVVSITAAGVQLLDGGDEPAAYLTAANAATATAGQLNGYNASLQETQLIRDQLNAMVSTLATGDVKVTLSNGYVTSYNFV